MPILVTGNTYAANDQVTSTNLNAAVNSATFASGAVDGVTTQLSSGSVIVRDGGISPAKLSTGGPSWNSGGTLTATEFSGPLTGNATNVTGIVAIANGGTGASTASGARTNLGVLGSNLNSNLASSVGVTQTAGSAGIDLVFNTANAPTVTLTAGTWLLIGSVAGRTTDIADTINAQFWNNTDSAAFGGGASQLIVDFARADLSCVGVITVASNKVIYFKVFRTAASTLDLGSSTPSGPAGFIQAVRLTN